MRNLFLTSAALVLGGFGMHLAAPRSAAEEASEQQRLREILRTAKPAPVPEGARSYSAAQTLSEGQRRVVSYDPATGETVVGAGWNATSAGSIPPDLPFRPERVPPSPALHATEPAVVLDTTVFPFNTVFKLLMRFRVSGTDFYYVCSAASAGEFHLLTAGHCIFNHDPNGNGNPSDARFADEVWAWAAQTDRVDPLGEEDYPYGAAKAVLMRSYTGWTVNENLDHDWGVVTLDRRVGAHTGWMGRETQETTSLRFSGYPVETPFVPAGTVFQYYGFDANNVMSYTASRILLDALIYGGHSGGPEWRFDDPDHFVQGINSTSNRMGLAEGTRLTDAKRTDLNNWMAEDETGRPPTARPELIEYVFSTTAKDLIHNTAAQGGPFDVEYNVLNAGFLSSGQVTVDFYLSTNTIISTSDRFVGSAVLNGLDAFTFANPTATLSVPPSVPVGNYFLGWILNSAVPEYNTDDNAVVISSEMLTVTPPIDDARIRVRKVTVGGDGTFDFTASFGAPFQLGNGGIHDSGLLPAGVYSVAETDPAPAFDLTAAVCDDGSDPAAIDLDSGETVTCTFTNTKRGMVSLRKTTNGNPATATVWNFTLTGPGVDASSSTPPANVDFDRFKLAPGATYSLCETGVPAGWKPVWQGDSNGDGIPETIIPMVEGVAGDPVDPVLGYSRVYDPNFLPAPDGFINDVRCVDFFVAPGETKAFSIDNSYTEGEPRTTGFWMIWSTCSGGDEADRAAMNGGPDAGWHILDDLLNDPGYTIGTLALGGGDCVKATALLDRRDVVSNEKQAEDDAYELAAQLLAALLNSSAGASSCSGSLRAVNRAQKLLQSLSFDGTGEFLASGKPARNAIAGALADNLDRYNRGLLCP